MNKTSYFLMTDDGRPKGGVSDYIPTEGYVTSALEMYRAIKLVTTGHEGWNSCYMDHHSAKCLAKVIEGKIESWHDLEAAEAALQGLLLYDRIDFLIPSYKSINTEGNLEFFERCKTGRTPLCFDLFRQCDPQDVLYPTEQIYFKGRNVIGSSGDSTRLFGVTMDCLQKNYFAHSKRQQLLIASLPSQMSVPGFFSDPLLEAIGQGPSNLFAFLHNSLAQSWDEIPRIVPRMEQEILLPPFLSIVGTRAKSREAIPETLLELRDELEAVRQELLEFGDTIERYKKDNPEEVEKFSLHISNSFKNIYAASKTKSNPLSTVLSIYDFVKTPFDFLLSQINPKYDSSPTSIANRTMTGLRFSNLIKDIYVAGVAKSILSDAELNLLINEKRH